jgi:DNA invertase Pin-like site-specific DNA recombinase
MENGACYIRVSTDDQIEFSPDAQLRAIKEYAQKNDIILAKEHIYIDEAKSGKTTNKRHAFNEMIATAKSKPKPFDVMLIHRFDRFARSREDSVVYKALLRRECGIKVISVTEKLEDDKFSIILEAILEAMAEYYSLNLADEVRKGMTEKAHRGGYQTTAPFGYEMVDKKLVIIPEEAEIIKFIFEKFTNKEMGMRKIAEYINDLGIKSKRGNLFENRTIDYILNNPVYIGKVRWTPSEKTRRNFNNPNSIIALGEHEPIITLDLWEKAQKCIKDNKDLYAKRQKTTANIVSWLNGLVKCGNCGKSLVISYKNYLQCNGYAKGTCKVSHLININTLEKLILEEIKKVYTNNLEINIVPKRSNEEYTSEYTFLNEALKKNESKEIRIKEAYQDGIDTIEEYKQNKLKLEEERRNLRERLENLKESLQGIQNNDPINKKLENAYELLTDENIPVDIKYKTSHFLINEVVYSKKEKKLTLEYK